MDLCHVCLSLNELDLHYINNLQFMNWHHAMGKQQEFGVLFHCPVATGYRRWPCISFCDENFKIKRHLVNVTTIMAGLALTHGNAHGSLTYLP